MKRFSFNFFFPSQPGSRQEHTEVAEGTSVHTAFSRAWRKLKHSGKYSGRKGLDNFRVGVVLVGKTSGITGQSNVVTENSYPDYDAINNTAA